MAQFPAAGQEPWHGGLKEYIDEGDSNAGAQVVVQPTEPPAGTLWVDTSEEL